jgi:pyrroline-5-carboxylate reductase
LLFSVNGFIVTQLGICGEIIGYETGLGKEKQMDKIGFLGGGNMAEALIRGITTAKVYSAENIFVSDVRPERLEYVVKEYHVQPAYTNASLAAEVDTLVLSVKPQSMSEALESVKEVFKPQTLVISIAAGVKVAKISAALGEAAIVRVMPNTPALIGEGASAVYANEKARPMLGKAEQIFSAVGKAVVVDDEDLIDAVTAVSGSGPAYYFLLMEEMIKAAGELGLAEEVAKELVLQTAKGAVLLAVEADERSEPPAELRRKVTSPGGTTEAALKVFAEGNLGPTIAAGIRRARDRSRELSG